MTKIMIVVFNLIFALPMVQPGAASADTPGIGGGGDGGPNVIQGDRDACWSEPPDLNGFIGSAEQTLMYGLESEIANDFVVSGSVITRASWGWGWYDESVCGMHPATPGFNLRFYEAGDCLPGALFADLSITNYTEEFLRCRSEHGVNDMYKATTDIAVAVTPGQIYWCGVQVKDHSFPPQAGRLSTGEITGCESAFKSAYFGFPDWVPTIEV